MPVYTNINTIKRQMEASNARFWTVMDSSDNVIAKCNPVTDKDRKPIDCFNDLQATLEDCSGDYAKVMVYTKPPNVDDDGQYKRGNVAGQQMFKYNVALTSPTNANISGAGDINMQRTIWDLQQQLKDRDREEADRKWRADMEKKIEGYESSNNPLFDKFFSKISDGLIDRLMGGEIKKQLDKPEPSQVNTPPVAGANAGVGERDVLVEFLETIASVLGSKEETIEAVKALTHFAKTKPAIFKETAAQLIEQSKEKV